MTWRTARAIDTFWAEVQKYDPGAQNLGTIGDTAHSTEGCRHD